VTFQSGFKDVPLPMPQVEVHPDRHRGSVEGREGEASSDVVYPRSLLRKTT
jgi:hypothetical protein